MLGWIVYQRGKEHRAACCQGAARPPEVQRRGVAVPDGFFTCRGCVDGNEGQGDLDQLFPIGHWEDTPSLHSYATGHGQFVYCRGDPIGVNFSTAVILSGAKDLCSAQREILRSAQDDIAGPSCLALVADPPLLSPR